MLELIKLERDGDTIDRMILHGVSAMMSKLETPVDSESSGATVYEVDFEGLFVEKSSEYYARESERYLAQNDVVQYLKKVGMKPFGGSQMLQVPSEPVLVPPTGRTTPSGRRTTCSNVPAKLLPRQSAPRRRIPNDRTTNLPNHRGTDTHIRYSLCCLTISPSHFLTKQMENTGLVPQLRDNKHDDLTRMYRLLGLVANGHNEMRKVLSDYIKELGREINEIYGGVSRNGEVRSPVVESPLQNDGGGADDEGPGESKSGGSTSAGPASDWAKWVEAVLGLKSKFDMILERSFNKDKGFQTVMNSAMETVVNLNSKAPEFVSLFIDENLRKGIKGKSEEDIEQLLDKTVGLFRFIQDKDVFERYYKQHLAKRLLLGRSLSEDAEKSLVAKLKVECGYQFTSKLEGMFNDMRVSTDLSNEFKTYLSNLVSSNASSLAEFNVNVLTSTYWPMPLAKPPVINCPASIQSLMDKFRDFYLGRHSGRQLTWITSMGSADLRATFDKGKKEINLTTYGMVVLCGVFNGDEACEGQPVSFTQIKEITEIPEPDLKRTLQSLSLGKYRILIKQPLTREVNESDSFKLNTSFTAPLLKIRIPNILPSAQSSAATGSGNTLEDDSERAETMTKIDQDRGHQVEAALVRIMKSRKSMTHNELLAEVIRQLSSRFTPSPGLIKKRIESLIERDYLERGAERKMLNYRA